MPRPQLATNSAVKPSNVVMFRERRIYGAEIELKVRPGDNITLICDRPLTHGSIILWIRNCSHENQPSLIIDYQKTFREMFPRFSLLKNSNINSFDLHITNITVSDLGLYYCAELERKVYKDKNGIIYSSDVYHYGNQTTHLSFAVTASSGPSSTVSPPPVSDCFLCWTLLFSVCPVCVLLSSICVYCLCQKKTTANVFVNQQQDVVCEGVNACSCDQFVVELVCLHAVSAPLHFLMFEKPQHHYIYGEMGVGYWKKH
ncbi:hypothetical protein IRJ41_000254 [Triplophysa rosa]|uniref:Ig-like domain-containing protein n=1 Tax=Triplophysa rosa TaxID=992332 RepID=A0A9W7WY50_TRIRA|nr:hypothetical protein IRJ41_000254 [Triplophysa rosa]